MSLPSLQLVKMQFEHLIEQTSVATVIEVLGFVLEDRMQRAEEAGDHWSAMGYRRLAEQLESQSIDAEQITPKVSLPQQT